MTAPLYVWYRGAFVAIGTNAHMQEERQKRSLYIIKTEGKGWKTTEIKRKKYRSVMCVSAAGSGLRSSL